MVSALMHLVPLVKDLLIVRWVDYEQRGILEHLYTHKHNQDELFGGRRGDYGNSKRGKASREMLQRSLGSYTVKHNHA